MILVKSIGYDNMISKTEWKFELDARPDTTMKNRNRRNVLILILMVILTLGLILGLIFITITLTGKELGKQHREIHDCFFRGCVKFQPALEISLVRVHLL